MSEPQKRAYKPKGRTVSGNRRSARRLPIPDARKPTAAEIARKVDGEPGPRPEQGSFKVVDAKGNVTDARDELTVLDPLRGWWG